MKAQPCFQVIVLAAFTAVSGCAPTYAPGPYGYGQAQSYAYGQQAPSYQSGQPAPLMPTDAAGIVTGNTVTIEAPVYNRGRIARYNRSSIYFAADGRAYSPSFAGQRWTARGDQVCMIGGANDCTTFSGDGTGQLFAQSGGSTFRVASVVPGDGANLRTAYRRNQNNEAVAGVLALGLLGAMMSGGDDSSGGGRNSDYYYRQSGSSSSSGGGSSYTAPIGGERGLYGSSHGVGD